MLSIQQALEIKESIVSYLKATFTFRKKSVAAAFDNFINHPTQGMFKGPYISLKLRFVKADEKEIKNIPLTIKPDWPPYDHQIKSWKRLSSHNKSPEPTIVTTGTGSGKTESFLYPALDYCFKQQHRLGVKVIILYPMNALATDQAKRLAEAIHEDNRLRGKITAGLFIGEGEGPKGEFPKTMDEKNIIEHRDTILDSPPDIILTNFKMLDYALMKHNFHKLWVHNLRDASLLRFLILDELHTYDGAQGTDVANLIRRLKLKLKIPKGQLCPIGTSATIGSGPEAPLLLADYASKVFGESITQDAIITENRISADEFFGDDDVLEDFLPRFSLLQTLEHNERNDFDEYLDAHISAWQLDKKQLAHGLLRLKIVKDLVIVCNKEKGSRTLIDVMRDLSLRNQTYRKVPQWDEENNFSPKERIIESLLTLISATRDPENARAPFMYLQVQLWIRELSNVQYTLEEQPKFTFRDQVEAQKELAALPPWYCRECNSSGWLGVKKGSADEFSKGITEVYQRYFEKNKNVYFILPGGTLSPEDLQTTGYSPDVFLEEKINQISLEILPRDSETGLKIQALRKVKNNKLEDACPCCNSNNTVAIIGTKVPTLSSIAVSQTLATDLDAAAERDRKVLAFTNAVQDAAHQAGFIEARNYRFTFRASIQKVINDINEPIRLSDLSKTFIDYWKEHADETGADKLSGYLYRFFPKDYIGKASPNEYKKGNHYYDHFLKGFDLRMEWETYSEFGFNSLIGRTLEKTGASSVFFDEEKIEKAWVQTEEWLKRNDVTGTVNQEMWTRFTHLVLHRMRQRGAVSHRYLDKFREGDFKLWDLNWMRDSRHYLNPKFGTRSRLPKLLTHESSRENLLDTTRAKNTNWFHAYFKKAFPLASDYVDFVNEFYKEWVSALVSAGVLDSSNGSQTTFAILPDAVWVKKNVKQYECDTCEQVLYTQDERKVIEDGPCLTYRCAGHFLLGNVPYQNYYKSVYNRNRFPRVYAAEHTGLLDRKRRENLENDFKKRTRFNSINALVATSTLEMGIDIGDLNTAYTNSVPPLPSNFLQRVGRAGRSSGAALIVNFARHQNHDLYYFTDPLEMMQGDVSTPGCYLEAKDILRRHFTAYCIDSWTSYLPNENVIPTFIRDLKLEQRNLGEEDFFINKINAFIGRNQLILVEEFLQQYDEVIRNEVFAETKESLVAGHFFTGLLSVFRKLKDELHNLEDKRKDLDDQIKTLQLAKGDPLFEELTREKRNLRGVRKSIQSRNVLEHLTNEGILPNYAFPETGVRLNAHVLSNQPEGTDNKAPDKDFEIVRAASQAIRELAPENFFYTQGYRFEITGINTFDWSDAINFHSRRFCSRCDHIEVDVTAPKGNCPKCDDPSWNSAANVHQFVRMTNVKSFNNESRASLTDANDDRDMMNYQIANHINIHQASSKGAWILKDIPFGIEYIKSAVISSVNYGRNDVMDARRLKINGEDVMTKGFVTCKHCGKSSSATHLPDHKFHFGFCSRRDVKYANQSDDTFEEVYLFREFQTEILKIVLPIQEFNTEADIKMFQAGIELGLKKYFRGNPDHIHILNYREFNRKTDKFDRFLILYDTIPGGTGYLEKLFDHREFSYLLRLSYEAIRDCECQLDGKDGCYKCIYSYGNQYNRADLSRERAEKWFGEIVSKTEDWESKGEGLTSLTTTGKIEESELENRFIRLLSIWANKQNGFSFSEEKIDGIVNYRLQIKRNGVDALYWIRPQITIGPKDEIQYSTRTDFLVTCSRYLKEGIDLSEQMKKLAIYLDGYQYHASAEHNIFEKDIEVRKSIAANPLFKTWTLTWKDLDYFENTISGDKPDTDNQSQLFDQYFKVNYNKLMGRLTGQKINYSLSGNNMSRLLFQLEHPVINHNSIYWFAFLSMRSEKFLQPSFDPADLYRLVAGEMPEDNYVLTSKVSDFDALLPVERLPHFDFAHWRIWVNPKQQAIYNHLEMDMPGSIDKEQWEVFWQYFNLFQSDQFLELSDFATEEEDLKSTFVEEMKELYEPHYAEFIEECYLNGWIDKENVQSLNSLTDMNGNILAEAEFVFVSKKIAVEPFTAEDKAVFENSGFQIYTKHNLGEINFITIKESLAK